LCANADTATERASAKARAIVKGAVDLHVHVAPDVMARSSDDLTLATQYGEAGIEGFVLKSHYVPTAERASVVNRAVPGARAIGAITLNAAIGGMNAMAVEIAAMEGARVVWFPTFDALNEPIGRSAAREGEVVPLWAGIQRDLRARGFSTDPVLVVDEEGRVLPQVVEVLRVIAHHDLVLATGHLGRDEIFAVVDAAIAQGVKRIIVTHPEFPSQNLCAEDQCALGERGALLERCFTTAYTGKTRWETVFTNIRKSKPEHSFISTDLGQPANPAVETGFSLMADRLLEAGFTADEIELMTVTNTRALVSTPRQSAKGSGGGASA
jgi:stage V sporulation protein SpoVS